jgi:hypothetical protein
MLVIPLLAFRGPRRPEAPCELLDPEVNIAWDAKRLTILQDSVLREFSREPADLRPLCASQLDKRGGGGGAMHHEDQQ